MAPARPSDPRAPPLPNPRAPPPPVAGRERPPFPLPFRLPALDPQASPAEPRLPYPGNCGGDCAIVRLCALPCRRPGHVTLCQAAQRCAAVCRPLFCPDPDNGGEAASSGRAWRWAPVPVPCALDLRAGGREKGRKGEREKGNKSPLWLAVGTRSLPLSLWSLFIWRISADTHIDCTQRKPRQHSAAQHSRAE